MKLFTYVIVWLIIFVWALVGAFAVGSKLYRELLPIAPIPAIELQAATMFSVEELTSDYDCDDAALDTVKQCQERGLDYRIVVGNLDITNEQYSECCHIWVLVNVGEDIEHWVAYDWGQRYYDEQHYEFYETSLQYLLEYVEYDKREES